MSESVNYVLPHWIYWGWLAIMPLIFMWLTRGSGKSGKSVPDEETALQVLAEEDPVLHEAGNRITRILDWMSEQSGVFVYRGQ